MTVWFQDNNLSLNVIKTKEMIVDWKKRTEHSPILIEVAVVEQVASFKFLGVHVTNKLTWSKHNNTVVKRAQQNLFPLRRLSLGMGPQELKRFYSCTIESIMTGCITAWYGNCSASDRSCHTVHHWGHASCHPGPLYQAVSEEGPKNCQRPQPP